MWTFAVLDHINSGFTGVFNSATLTFTYGGGATYKWTADNPTVTTISTLANPGLVTPPARNNKLYSYYN